MVNESAGTTGQDSIRPSQKVWGKPRNALQPVEHPPPVLFLQTTNVAGSFGRLEAAGLCGKPLVVERWPVRVPFLAGAILSAI